MSSIYIHIPFCASKCPYCDFYSLCDFSRQAAYVNRCVEILREHSTPWRTAYIGGGTPSVLAPELLARLLAAIECEGEFTVECNPTSVTPEFCRAIIEGGINRVSMGVQSAVAAERKALGRSGDIEAVERAIEMLPVGNLSLDVMLGIPGQTRQSAEKTLAFCAKYARHISAYLLKIEPGTPFAAHPPAHLPEEDAQADLYLHACEWLEAHGFAQYEISNFAQPGHESRHNLNTWRCGEYFAVGPAAHGFTQGRRWHYPRDLAAFLRGGAPVDDGPGGDFEERAMLALRLSEGFAGPTAQMRGRAKALPGLAEVNGNSIKLTREGFLLSNAVIGRLLG
ncbi:MAG: radical SAM family heme chaperone HemW [Oscillospiraceae bacterium]|jgi:oxygen-independent coproporphyrinogen-3 oxidase|nr:radical SAM family heme chaperone HemW [Oscillospiraceae bacterium]